MGSRARSTGGLLWWAEQCFSACIQARRAIQACPAKRTTGAAAAAQRANCRSMGGGQRRPPPASPRSTSRTLPPCPPCPPSCRRNQDKCRDFNDNDRPLCQMYTVQAGDTATEIAQKYKVWVGKVRVCVFGGGGARRRPAGATAHGPWVCRACLWALP